MLIALGFVFLLLWILGIAGVYSLGWFIYILLALAIISFLVRIIQGRNPLQ